MVNLLQLTIVLGTLALGVYDNYYLAACNHDDL